MEESLEMVSAFGLPNGARRVFKRPLGYEYDLYYADEVGEPSEYLEDFQIYSSASSSDIVNVKVNSVGGRMDTTIQIINNMRQCQAPLVGHLEAEANSAAGIILLQCDSWVIHENGSLMIHEPSYGTINSANKLAKEVKFSEESHKRLYERCYKHFLSDEEITKVLEGGDLWLGNEEIVERLNIRKEILERESKDED